MFFLSKEWSKSENCTVELHNMLELRKKGLLPKDQIVIFVLLGRTDDKGKSLVCIRRRTAIEALQDWFATYSFCCGLLQYYSGHVSILSTLKTPPSSQRLAFAQEKIAHEHLRKDLGVKDVEDCVYDVSHYVDWLVGARLVAG